MKDVMFESDLDFTRFLIEICGDAWASPHRIHRVSIPNATLIERAYDDETEQLRRFIRGQQITERKTA